MPHKRGMGEAMMNRKRTLSITFAALFPAFVLFATNGCSGCSKKDDEDKTAASASASAAPAPTPTPVTTATVMPEEDAGAKPSDAGTGDAGDGGKPAGTGAATSIAKCCAALRQNANNAPLDQKAYYMAAAGACEGQKGNPSAQQAFASIRQTLQGAKMPGACQ